MKTVEKFDGVKEKYVPFIFNDFVWHRITELEQEGQFFRVQQCGEDGVVLKGIKPVTPSLHPVSYKELLEFGFKFKPVDSSELVVCGKKI